MESTTTDNFFLNNIIPIIFIVVIFSCITIAIILYDIRFPEKEKEKVDRVIVIENYTPNITSKDLAIKGKNNMNNNSTCGKLDNKISCTALDSCVWVDGKLNKKFIEKCVAANKVLTTSKAPSGSEGPEETCFKHNGKLVPWENFYYEDGGKQIKKKITDRKC